MPPVSASMERWVNKLSNRRDLTASMALGATYKGAPTDPSVALEMLQAEARVWVSYIRPIEDLTGERSTQDVASDPLFLTVLDSIDFTALREFLEIIGNGLKRAGIGL